MRVRIIGLTTVAALVAPALLGQVATVQAATAQVFVTGYVLRGYTATGTYTHPGTCAVDPRVIPLGSYVTISGLGTCHAEDTGGAVIGYHIDVWEPTVAQAYAITGWHTATWGAASQQVLGYHAANPHAPTPHKPAPAPAPKPAIRPRVKSAVHVGYRTHVRHAAKKSASVPAGLGVMHPAMPPVASSPTAPGQAYLLIGLSGKGCHSVTVSPASHVEAAPGWSTVCN